MLCLLGLWHKETSWKSSQMTQAWLAGPVQGTEAKAGVQGRRWEFLPCSLQLHPLSHPSPSTVSHTRRRNKTSISRECVWKIPGFIRQADVQADSFISMHMITGIYRACVPAPSLPPSHKALGQDVHPPNAGGLGFLSRMIMSPCSLFFQSQIPRGLLRKLSENWAGNCSPLGTDSHLDPWERRHLSGSIFLKQHRAGSVCVTGSKKQTTNAMALEGEPKRTILGGKGLWLSWGAPSCTQAPRLCTGHARAAGQRKGGREERRR